MSIIASGTTSGSALVSTGNTNGNLVFQTNGTTTALTLATDQLATFAGKASFPSTIGVGGATAAASGSGVSFPATQSTSSDVNTLDDYEEGSFTPTITFGGASVGITYSSRVGTYVKVGSLVNCYLYILLTSKGSSTGQFLITGLPFANSNAAGAHAASSQWATGLSSISGTFVGYALNGDAFMYFAYLGTGTQTIMDNTNLTNTSAFMVNITYRTT
jgi:hypothetical protein